MSSENRTSFSSQSGERRPSYTALSTTSRSSTMSSNPTSQLPFVPTSSPPVPPPKDRLPPPMTPQRKPVLRQKSPLSSEAYSTIPASSMPGAFPTTPPAGGSLPTAEISSNAYASSPLLGSAPSASPKRPGSFRNLLSFKALRRSLGNESPGSGSPDARPASPGGESMASSRPSLKKKMSGSFWRRKSSMGMNFEAGDENGNGHAGTGTNGNDMSIDTIMRGGEEGGARSSTPMPDEDAPRIGKRKSGTFWRRSSGTLAGVLENEKHGWSKKPSEAEAEVETDSWRDEDTNRGGVNFDKPLPDFVEPKKTASPPPQIPEFIGGGEGLGGEDLFKDIH